MKKNNLCNVVKIALFVVPIIMLPGCGALDWVKGKLGMSKPQTMSDMSDVGMSDDMDMEMEMEKKTRNELNEAEGDSETLVTLGGKPVVTSQVLEDELEQLVAEFPELKAMLPMLPDVKRNLLMGMLSQIIIDEWSDRNFMHDNPEFKKELDRMIKQAKRVVNQKYFSKHHPIEISDAELKTFYDKHKDKMLELMISKGGINAVGIPFDDESSAQAFLAKAQSDGLSDAAKSQGMEAKIREFKEVGQHTPGVDQSIRAALLSMTRFPSTQLVQSGKEYWVVQGISKEDPQYQEFSAVKDMIRPAAEKEIRIKHLEDLIEKYKKEYDVKVNEDALKSSEPAQGMPQGMPANFGEMMEEEGPVIPAAA